MPQIGSGVLTGSYGPYRGMAAIYLATYNASSLAPSPTAALGDTEPASATWTKLGLLQSDDFTPAKVDATLLDDRRGFKKVLYGQAITQAGEATFEALVVESDPAAIGRITGQAASAVGTGEELRVSYDQIYTKTALIYVKNAFTDDTTNIERFYYIPKAQVAWSMDRGENDVMVLRVNIHALQYSQGAENYLFLVGRFPNA